MKKLVSLILVLLLTFSLIAMVSCSDSNQDAQDNDTPSNSTPDDTSPDGNTPDDGAEITQETLLASKPNEYVPEKLAAGMEVTIAFNPASMDGIGTPQDQLLQAYAEEKGLKYICSTWEQDTATQIQQIENWITMGVAAVAVHTADPEGVADITAEAEAAGTSIIFYGTQPTYFCSAMTSVDLDAMGYSSALIARAWVDQTYPDAGPGEIKAAAFGFYIVTDVGILSDALKRGLSDIEQVEIVYTHDNATGIETGYNATEEAFTANPDIKLIGSYDLFAAFGANNYIMSMPNVNPEEYCIVGTTSNQDVFAFIEQAKTNESVLRGTTAGHDDAAYGLKICFDAILFEGVEKPYVFLEPLNPTTSFDFDYDTYFADYYTTA